ncbi:MAG: haloacid dehalogenase type II [Betaproteobacteria bacterium]
MSDANHAIVFDAYGTLFDVHSVVDRCNQLFPGRGVELSQLWRSKQLEYSWLRTLMGRYENFDTLTRDALHYACRVLQLNLSENDALGLLREYRTLAPHAEVQASLLALRPAQLAILSNGTAPMLHAVVEHAGLNRLFEQIISVDDLKIFKPHPRVYQLAVERLGVAKHNVVFVSSNFWDVAGATGFGFKTFWINRSGIQADELGIEPAGVLRTLAELPAAVAAIS